MQELFGQFVIFVIRLLGEGFTGLSAGLTLVWQ